MWQAIGKYVGGRVFTAVLVLAAAAAVVWYWRLPGAAKDAIWTTIGYGALWLVIAAALPWSMFFVVPAVVRAESNLVSALFVLALWVVDIALGLVFAGGGFPNPWAWGAAVLGFLCAGVYNLLVCDFLAHWAEDRA
jgi:hypothetical protein